MVCINTTVMLLPVRWAVPRPKQHPLAASVDVDPTASIDKSHSDRDKRKGAGNVERR